MRLNLIKTLIYCTILTGLSVTTSIAQTSTTPTIGYYKLDIPAGTSAWGSALVTKTEFQGQGTASGSVITQAGATWAVNQFSGVNNAYYVEILSGLNTGAIIDIVSNTATSVTLDTDLSTLTPAVSGNVTYCIRKHSTVATLFSGGAGLDAFSDTVTVIDSSGSEQAFTYDGASWVDAVDGTTVRNSYPIYPGQGFLLNLGSPKTITLGGGEVSYVKNGPTKIFVYGGVSNLVTIMNPLAGSAPADKTALGGLGIPVSLDAFSDTLLTFTSDGLLGDDQIFTSDGTLPVDGVDGTTDKSTALIRNASAVLVTVGTNRFYSQPQTHP